MLPTSPFTRKHRAAVVFADDSGLTTKHSTAPQSTAQVRSGQAGLRAGSPSVSAAQQAQGKAGCERNGLSISFCILAVF
ncbi:predicted protein [Plenodomus lingam JN3]|uniref:Uncharacterized protein n=1 Tax=Leptosphaeria maculans (strain JN3 / isolate v23.1.3 / race Av1-4-5-6-7-8) TaxID=985895 RepID=E4ZG89_LEPMJ|nr:predicted protein [Plenodomus lingam JN3]CBX90309.1 predicted protein [Plenodomus lingam JN3]